MISQKHESKRKIITANALPLIKLMQQISPTPNS